MKDGYEQGDSWKYGEEVGAINTDLTQRATNFSNLFNSAYDYLGSELGGL